jgi:hypothetical protein
MANSVSEGKVINMRELSTVLTLAFKYHKPFMAVGVWKATTWKTNREMEQLKFLFFLVVLTGLNRLRIVFDDQILC